MILTAIIRSLIQWGFTKLVALAPVIALVNFINGELGIAFDLNDYRGWAEALLFGVVVALAGAVGNHPVVGPIFNKIISFGRAATGPAYAPTIPAAPTLHPVDESGPVVAVVTDPESNEAGDANLGTVLTILVIVILVIVLLRLA